MFHPHTAGQCGARVPWQGPASCNIEEKTVSYQLKSRLKGQCDFWTLLFRLKRLYLGHIWTDLNSVANVFVFATDLLSVLRSRTSCRWTPDCCPLACSPQLSVVCWSSDLWCLMFCLPSALCQSAGLQLAGWCLNSRPWTTACTSSCIEYSFRVTMTAKNVSQNRNVFIVSASPKILAGNFILFLSHVVTSRTREI